MKVRYTKYSDYGMSLEDEKRIKQYCRTNIDARTTMIISTCAFMTNPQIALEITYSLQKGLSYEKMCCLSYVPIDKGDFYAYRRKCLTLIKDFLDENKVHTKNTDEKSTI